MNASGHFTVIVTRPAHQSKPFIDQLKKCGANVVALPTIDIRFRDSALSNSEQQQLDHSSLWIFTSANAVAGAAGLGVFDKSHTAVIACIGQATATALHGHGVTADLVPGQNTNSEGLLSLLEKQVDLNCVVILRGGEGRDKLRQELSDSGRKVYLIDVYERREPALPATTVRQSLNSLPCTISVTSNQGLLNLLALIPADHHEALFQCGLVVNSQRCESLARELGFRQRIAVADPPGDHGQLLAVKKLQLSANL